jgi:hypothetical protein
MFVDREIDEMMTFWKKKEMLKISEKKLNQLYRKNCF